MRAPDQKKKINFSGGGNTFGGEKNAAALHGDRGARYWGGFRSEKPFVHREEDRRLSSPGRRHADGHPLGGGSKKPCTSGFHRGGKVDAVAGGGSGRTLPTQRRAGQPPPVTEKRLRNREDSISSRRGGRAFREKEKNRQAIL